MFIIFSIIITLIVMSHIGIKYIVNKNKGASPSKENSNNIHSYIITYCISVTCISKIINCKLILFIFLNLFLIDECYDNDKLKCDRVFLLYRVLLF